MLAISEILVLPRPSRAAAEAQRSRQARRFVVFAFLGAAQFWGLISGRF